MKRLKALMFVSAALLSTAPINASGYDASCCQPRYEACDDCCTVLSLQGDLLHWRGRKCELDYALPYDNDYYMKGAVKAVHPGWNGGFRVGVFTGDPDGVTVGVRYTNFRNHSTSTTIRRDAQLAATQASGFHRYTSDGDIQYAQGRYRVSLDLVDIEGSYNNQLDSAALSLFGGFKLATLDQKFRVVYAEDSEDIEGDDIDRIFLKSNMDAYGLYIGGSLDWDLCGGFGLFGRTSIAALVGGFDRRAVMDGQNGGSEYIVSVDFKDHCKRVVTNFDMSIGGYYTFCGTCNTQWVIKIGYDFSHWFNTVDFIKFSGYNGNDFAIDHNSDSVGFDGLFVRLEVNF